MQLLYNISALVNHILKNEFSYKINMECLHCQYKRKDKYNLLEVNPKQFYEHHMNALERTVNEQYIYNNKKCTRCNEDRYQYRIFYHMRSARVYRHRVFTMARSRKKFEYT